MPLKQEASANQALCFTDLQESNCNNIKASKMPELAKASKIKTSTRSSAQLRTTYFTLAYDRPS